MRVHVAHLRLRRQNFCEQVLRVSQRPLALKPFVLGVHRGVALAYVPLKESKAIKQKNYKQITTLMLVVVCHVSIRVP